MPMFIPKRVAYLSSSIAHYERWFFNARFLMRADFSPVAETQPQLRPAVLERDYLADTRAPGPEESSQVNLFHLCFGCAAQIERMQGQIETIPPCVLLGRVPIKSWFTRFIGQDGYSAGRSCRLLPNNGLQPMAAQSKSFAT